MKKRIANVGFISVIVAFISVVAACSHAPNPPVDSASNNTKEKAYERRNRQILL